MRSPNVSFFLLFLEKIMLFSHRFKYFCLHLEVVIILFKSVFLGQKHNLKFVFRFIANLSARWDPWSPIPTISTYNPFFLVLLFCNWISYFVRLISNETTRFPTLRYERLGSGLQIMVVDAIQIYTRPQRVCWPGRCQLSLRPPRWSRIPLRVDLPSWYDYKGPLCRTGSSGSVPASPWTCTGRCYHSLLPRTGQAKVPCSHCSSSSITNQIEWLMM